MVFLENHIFSIMFFIIFCVLFVLIQRDKGSKDMNLVVKVVVSMLASVLLAFIAFVLVLFVSSLTFIEILKLLACITVCFVLGFIISRICQDV